MPQPRPLAAGAAQAAPRPIAPVQHPAAPRPIPANRPLPAAPGSAMPRADEEEEEAGELGFLDRYLRASPPWLISSVVHMILLIVLGVWLLARVEPNVVELEVVYAEQEGEELADDAIDFEAEVPTDEMILTPENVIEVMDPFAAPPQLDVNFMGAAPSSDIVAPQIGMALNGREEGMRRALLEAYGGNAQSEAAVRMALEWLAKQQQKDGSWSLTGPYADGVPSENTAAATAMALLAFQGNGHTHKKGLYKKQVDEGIKHLLKLLDNEGAFFRDSPGHARLYTQGQCTIAICELYAMSRDSALREPAQRAINFCVKYQDSLGGWRYVPGDDSDTSVTGWILMGMQSARMAGLEVPQKTLDGIGNYLDKAGKLNGARYSYTAGGGDFTEAMTAEGLLCRQYLGWKQDDERMVDGSKYLLEPQNLPNWSERDVYYWYYATQVHHHLEGPGWEKWNSVMRDLLVDKQVKAGAERGSWDPMKPTPDRWGGHAGRLYVTCLSTYILEVYYRHLPIYSPVRL